MGKAHSSLTRKEGQSSRSYNDGASKTPNDLSDLNLDIKQLFIKQLQAKYKQLYDAVQPIPYIRERLYCVDRVFVEGGIDYILGGSWVSLESYHGVFTTGQIKSSRKILIGEAGYGKSILTLQYAYDWCNRIKESALKDVEILILLRLRQLGGVHSIHKAIKEFLIPRNSRLTESNIQNVIDESSSMLLILDGFDEYPDGDSDITTDILKIIRLQMFQRFEVILTTRYLPKQCPPTSKHLRLTGFDEQTRDEYIRKAVVGYNSEDADIIKRRLQENPVLRDLCQVPLFFVLFAHMSHEKKDFRKLKTVTSFFQYMIKCFHSHMRNKMKDKNVKWHELNEKHHDTLDKVAFEGLSRANQQIVWRRGVLRDRLGHHFYDQYISIGILVEEEVIGSNHYDASSNVSYGQYQTEVRFYHKLFCEWYAAHYLARCAEENSLDNLRELTKHMDVFDLQYCFRFACGLNNAAAGKLIQYVKKQQGGEKFAVLCVLEQGDKVDGILDMVQELCLNRIDFKQDDNKLLQRSTIHLLEIASSHKISISCLYLTNSYSTVDLRGGNHLQLKSNLSIPVLNTLNKLWIEEKGKEIPSEEFAGILQYSSKCLGLKELWFGYCLLPPSVQADSLSVLTSSIVKVLWGTSGFIDWYLNLSSGRWKRGGSGKKMTDEDYQSEVEKFRSKYRRRLMNELFL